MLNDGLEKTTKDLAARSVFATDCKGSPSNIGVVRASIKIYDHNPFWARPYQNIAFPFTTAAGAEAVSDFNYKDKVTKDSHNASNIIFDEGEAYLKPLDKMCHTFVATIKDVEKADKTKEQQLDIANPLSGSPLIKSYLPGGKNYEQLYFSHRLFIHKPSSIYGGKVKHPSEYFTPIIGSTVNETLQNLIKLATEEKAPIWDLRKESDPKSKTDRVYPVMIGRKSCSGCNDVHWTLEKYTPFFQGQDFIIEIKPIDTNSTVTKITKETFEEELDTNPMKEYDPAKWGTYWTPCYTGKGPPQQGKFSPSGGFIPTGAEFSPDPLFENGISNQPFFLNLNAQGEDLKSEEKKQAIENFISDYYLKNKAYWIIELGVGDPNNHYFIEFVQGRSPRFFHFGTEIRGEDAIGSTGLVEATNRAYHNRRKLRSLSVCDWINTTELINSEKVKITVRQHVGRLFIQINDYPVWRIDRIDLKWDSDSNQPIPTPIPLVIPRGKMRVHGGNMTMGFSFSPVIYTHSGQVIFRDRQADIGEVGSETLANENVYVTFAQPGDADNNPRNRSRSKSFGLFTDAQFINLKMGYSADAYVLEEIHKNNKKKVLPYQYQKTTYEKAGREYVYQSDIEEFGVSKLTINAANSTRPFSLDLSGLDPSIMGTDGKHIGKWDIQIGFTAGNMKLPPAEMSLITTSGHSIYADSSVFLLDCITPIATCWSLIILGGGKVITNQMTEDITEFVESVGDGWSIEGYECLNHETKLKLYLPIGTGISETESKVQRLLSLRNKTFYITIGYWWDHGAGLDHSVQSVSTETWKAYSREDDPRLIQMTGIAYGGQIERTANKIRMEIDVKDYMEPLKQMFIWNCPFFDSCSDVSAVFELAKIAGFDNTPEEDKDINKYPGLQQTKGIDRRPLGFLQKLQQTNSRGIIDPIIYNEEKHIHDYFALPAVYADLNDPTLKFSNGTPIKDVMQRLLRYYGKTMYFDRYGVFIVELAPAKLTAFRRAERQTGEQDSPLFHVDIQELVKVAFVTSPLEKIFDIQSKTYVDFDAEEHAAFQIFNGYTVNQNVSEAINTIAMYSVQSIDENQAGTGWLAKGRTFYEQIWEPESEGFFGYKKVLWNQDGIYGDSKSMNAAMTHYARFKYPPLQVKFETFGIPGLKPLDVIVLNRQPLYITEINHDIDPKENNWWMTISAEWIKSFDDKLLLPMQGETDVTNPAAN